MEMHLRKYAKKNAKFQRKEVSKKKAAPSTRRKIRQSRNVPKSISSSGIHHHHQGRKRVKRRIAIISPLR